jgi:hypothetical protein
MAKPGSDCRLPVDLGFVCPGLVEHSGQFREDALRSWAADASLYDTIR